MGDDQAEALGHTLFNAHKVEGLAMDILRLPNVAERESYLKQIDEAAGKFEALAKLLKVA